MEEGAARGRSVARLNVLIAITAAVIGLIYGYDLGSIASALLFLVPPSTSPLSRPPLSPYG